jgi:hypothetical protein
MGHLELAAKRRGLLGQEASSPASERVIGFFLAAHYVLLAIVLVGLGRAFHLRAFFDVGPLPVRP